MPFVVAALVLLGLVCVVNLVLTFGLIKRLREQAGTTAVAAEPSLAIGPGDVPGAFMVSTLDGEPVTPDTVAGRLVGFFASGCRPCQDALPAFAAHLGRLGDRRRTALAVVVEAGADVSHLVDPLRDLVPVVVEPPMGPMAEAFRATGFPSFYVLDTTGTVTVSGHNWDRLPVPERA